MQYFQSELNNIEKEALKSCRKCTHFKFVRQSAKEKINILISDERDTHFRHFGKNDVSAKDDIRTIRFIYDAPKTAMSTSTNIHSATRHLPNTHSPIPLHEI